MAGLVRRMKQRRGMGTLGRGGLGSLGDTSAQGLVDTIVKGATVAVDVASDPYMPEVLCRVQQLHQINAHQPVSACANTPMGIGGGVGLERAIRPLRAFVYAEQHKWVYVVAIAALVGIPFLIGYELGGD